MRSHRIFSVAVLCLGVVIGAGKPAKPAPKEKEKENVEALEYQCAALKLLHELDPSPEQIQALKAVAPTSAGKPANVPEQSGEYKAALVEYVDALASDDEEKIGAAEEKVEDLRDTDKIDPLPDMAPTDTARSEAGKIVSMLAANQLANYISEHADEVPDPVQTMTDAAEQARTAGGEDYNTLRAEAVQQFATLVVGATAKSDDPVAVAAGKWLDDMKAQPDKDYEAGEADRVKQLKALAHNVDAFDVLRHWMDREMVDLLSNPQLLPALKKLKSA